MTLIESMNRAWPKHAPAAREAYGKFSSYCAVLLPRVPGMDTLIRLAIRIDNGRTVDEAAAREYVYRWNLALRSPIFGVPHTLGM